MSNGDVVDYQIDVLHRRVGKKLNGTVQAQWVYKDQINPIAELYPDGGVKYHFVYGEKVHVPDAIEHYGNDGVLIAKYRVISNHLGSVSRIVNADTGEVLQDIKYDAWGNVLSDSSPGFQPFYFAGGFYDQHSKLTRFGARDYDAEVGRWTAKDPIGFAGWLTSLYDYVGGDPINLIDITGNRWRKAANGYGGGGTNGGAGGRYGQLWGNGHRASNGRPTPALLHSPGPYTSPLNMQRLMDPNNTFTQEVLRHLLNKHASDLSDDLKKKLEDNLKCLIGNACEEEKERGYCPAEGA